MPPGTISCAVCDAPIPPRRAGPPVCGTARCRWTWDATPPERRCRACDRPLQAHELSARLCSRPACRTVGYQETARAHVAAERERRAALAATATGLRDAAGVPDATRFPLVLVPAQRSPLEAMTPERRALLAANLSEVIAAAVAGTPDAVPEYPRPLLPLSPVAADVFARACGHCRGYCCKTGGDHAYIRGATVRRVLDADPTRTPDDVLAAYLSRVPAETTAGSCVYHGPDGCGLPAELRSDTCNRYFCDALAAFHARIADGDPIRAFLAAADDEVRETAFVEAT